MIHQERPSKSPQWEDDAVKTMLVIVFGILKMLSYEKMIPFSLSSIDERASMSWYLFCRSVVKSLPLLVKKSVSLREFIDQSKSSMHQKDVFRFFYFVFLINLITSFISFLLLHIIYLVYGFVLLALVYCNLR